MAGPGSLALPRPLEPRRAPPRPRPPDLAPPSEPSMTSRMALPPKPLAEDSSLGRSLGWSLEGGATAGAAAGAVVCRLSLRMRSSAADAGAGAGSSLLGRRMTPAGSGASGSLPRKPPLRAPAACFARARPLTGCAAG